MIANTETGSKTIYRFDNILDINTCNRIYGFMMGKLSLSPRIEDGIMPWHANEAFVPWDLQDQDLKEKVKDYRKIVTELVCDSYNRKLYPEFTHFVLWREGRWMDRHKDDGYVPNDPLSVRKVSCVTYVNDDFIGGETYIANETGVDYQSKPVQGSLVCYLSDESNAHGVNRITKGNRVTLPIWFTDDFEKSEFKRIGF
jgi:2OG-Fe(II) oxygenase superfamily